MLFKLYSNRSIDINCKHSVPVYFPACICNEILLKCPFNPCRTTSKISTDKTNVIRLESFGKNANACNKSSFRKRCVRKMPNAISSEREFAIHPAQKLFYLSVTYIIRNRTTATVSEQYFPKVLLLHAGEPAPKLHCIAQRKILAQLVTMFVNNFYRNVAIFLICPKLNFRTGQRT